MNADYSKSQRICLESWNQFYPKRQREIDSKREELTLFRMIKKQFYETVKKLDLLDEIKVSTSMEFFIYLEYPAKKDFTITISIDSESEEFPLEVNLNNFSCGKYSLTEACEKITELVEQS